MEANQRGRVKVRECVLGFQISAFVKGVDGGVSRKATIENIRSTIQPLLRSSGWRQITGIGEGGIQSEPVRLCAYKDRQPRAVAAFVFDEIHAFTDEGVITDMAYGGALTTPWEEMPVEDLRRVLTEARRAVREDALD